MKKRKGFIIQPKADLHPTQAWPRDLCHYPVSILEFPKRFLNSLYNAISVHVYISFTPILGQTKASY